MYQPFHSHNFFFLFFCNIFHKVSLGIYTIILFNIFTFQVLHQFSLILFLSFSFLSITFAPNKFNSEKQTKFTFTAWIVVYSAAVALNSMARCCQEVMIDLTGSSMPMKSARFAEAAFASSSVGGESIIISTPLPPFPSLMFLPPLIKQSLLSSK